MAIVKQLDRRSGITYAYESKSYWDKEKKQSRSTRTLIGRVDPETGEIVPTDNRNRAKSLPSDRQEKRGRTSFTKNKRLFYGATYLFDQIGKQTGVTEDLKKCFPDSFKKILGNSYGLWIATEINQHYDNDDSETSFIKVAFGRLIAAKQPKILWDLNPSDPNHKIYREYIDKYKLGYLGGYNYEHFTIMDNKTISPERREQIKQNYDINTIWYKRDILGERCVAEGLIYREFADNNNKYVIDSVNKDDIWFIRIGIDFGNSLSSHTFVATGVGYNFKEIIPLKEKKILGSAGLTPNQLDERFYDFITQVYKTYNRMLVIRCDNAETTLINGFKAKLLKEGCAFAVVKGAIKKPIIDRIKITNRIMGDGRFKICKECENLINAFNGAVWDSKHPDERLDEVGINNPVDMLDAFEYSIEEDINDIIKTGR